MTLTISSHEETGMNAEQYLRAGHRQICSRTDKLIALVMCIQWFGAIIASLLISPRTWEGSISSIHPHLFAAIYIGGLVTVFPVCLAIFQPGEKFTRHVIAACQMLMSGLLIHITGGRIETHFHVFGSLAFLALYLDWPVLVTATITILLDHSVMAYFNPTAIFGTGVSAEWRFVEHVLWVVFFDTFLITSCIQNLRALKKVAHREADQEGLLYQAYHDALTGLGNRLLIQKAIGERYSQRKQNPGQSFALMAIDLDRFKEVNDTLGHLAGDDILKQASHRIKHHIRGEDLLCRMGGDEFALIIDDCRDVELAESIAERIVESLNIPFECGPHTVHIGVSIGICLNHGAATEPAELFHHADLALYKVKNNGRNCVLVFDERMRAETLHQISLEHRLRNAVLAEALHLQYQPIVATGSSMLGFEALLRWTDEVHGSVSPAEFIPIAERTGLIVPLGNWVLRQACIQAAEWHRAGKHLHKMSVNVSSIQLAHHDFVSHVLQVLKETGLPPELLDLELTETALIQNHGESQKSLDLLRKFGVRLSIDDFGTGYSSLSYVRDLPVHTLKIDRSFVKDIVGSSEARLLVEGMIDMAHSLNLRVVAEGVEDTAQLDLLDRAGCDEIQGFLISKAVNSDDALKLLNDIATKQPSESSSSQVTELRPGRPAIAIAS